MLHSPESISQEVCMDSIHNTCLEITHLELIPHHYNNAACMDYMDLDVRCSQKSR